MNFLSILIRASGSSHLWKKVAAPHPRIWKMACTTVAAPFSTGLETSKADLCDGVSASVQKEKAKVQREKRKIFQKLRYLTTGETLDLILREEEKKGVSVTQIFEWMDKMKIFSPSELALYVDLIDKVRGLAAAQEFFEKVDPNFNNMDTNSKNWPAYMILSDLTEDDYKNSRLQRH